MLRIKDLLQKKKGFDILVKECGEYLAPGNYHVEQVFGKLALKKGRFPKKNLRNWYFQLIFGTFRVRNSGEGINCNIALLSPFRNFKMVDETAGLTYTRFADDYWENALLFYDTMAPYIPSLILSVDRERHILVEKLARSVKIQDQKQCFLTLCESYMKYLDNVSWNHTLSIRQVKETLDSKRVSPEIMSYISYIENKVLDDTENYPVIICHNDMHIKNVLTEDNLTFDLIDFELCGENVFFFDILGFIFNSAVFKGDYTLFNMYMNGVFDMELGRLFECFSLIFDNNDRCRYIYLFLIFKIYIVYNTCPEFLNSYTKKINSFINYLSNCNIMG